MRADTLHTPPRARAGAWRRLRFPVCVTAYAGAIGAAAVLITFLLKTDIAREPQHMALVPSLFMAGGGAVACVALAWPSSRWLGQDAGRPFNLISWLAMGLGFGLILPFLTAALLPLSAVFMDLAMGNIGASDVVSRALSSVFRMPNYIVIHGSAGIITGILAGAAFGAGAWVLDRLDRSSVPWVSAFGPWTFALLLSLTIVLFAALAPPDTLVNLG